MELLLGQYPGRRTIALFRLTRLKREIATSSGLATPSPASAETCLDMDHTDNLLGNSMALKTVRGDKAFALQHPRPGVRVFCLAAIAAARVGAAPVRASPLRRNADSGDRRKLG